MRVPWKWNSVSSPAVPCDPVIGFARNRNCMPIDPRICSATLKKLENQLDKLEKKPSTESIHKFRTHSRRVETWFQELLPKMDRNERQWMKSLRRLRKKAGKVRDLDAQIDLLAKLNSPQESRRKTQLLCAMKDEHEVREKKFRKALRSGSIPRIRKGLRRTLPISEQCADAQPVSLAMRMFAQISRSQTPLTEARLHQFRIIGKRARYIAELAGNAPEAKQLVGELKHMQDVIGDWHDWLQLTARAEKLFSEAHDSALLAALRNLTRAKFRQAVEVLAATRENLAVKAVDSTQGNRPRKPPLPVAHTKAAVA